MADSVFSDQLGNITLLSRVILASLESMAIFTQKRGVPDNWNYIKNFKIGNFSRSQSS